MHVRKPEWHGTGDGEGNGKAPPNKQKRVAENPA
jgi:hypothetical protein